MRLPWATYLNYSFPVCFKKWTTMQSQRGAPSEKLLKRASACLVGSREFSRMNPAFCSNSCVVAGNWCSCAQLHLQVSLDGFHLVALALLLPLREAAWVFTDMSSGIRTVNLSNVGGVRVQFAILTCWSLIRCMRCCFTLPFRFAERMSCTLTGRACSPPAFSLSTVNLLPTGRTLSSPASKPCLWE